MRRVLIRTTGRTCRIRRAYPRSTNITALSLIGGDAPIETLANHKPFFTPDATEAILRGFNSGGSDAEVPELIRDQLTAREREIVQLLAEGRSAKEGASVLSISVKTTETRRSNIMRKLEIHNTSELVRYAIRSQIIEA